MLALQIPFAAIADDVADAVGALTVGTAGTDAESAAIVETAAPDAGLTLGPDELPWETLQDLRPDTGFASHADNNTCERNVDFEQ